tara:strand:+ start:1753 stop:2730 length:978 start_codon:yes stop_codon:yes gene_type:complete
MTINIIGSGTWAIALSSLLLSKFHKIILFHRNSKSSQELIENLNHPFLTNYKISEKILFTENFNDLDINGYTIIATPSTSIYEIFSKYNFKNHKLIIATKGFDSYKEALISDLLIDLFKLNNNKLAFLSGPNHAEEIVMKKPSTTVVASVDINYAKDIQEIFSSNYFRVYTSTDTIGIQIGGSIKNVIAIAAGISKGLNLGDNIQAAIVTRGLYEIMQLKKVYKFKDKTIYGLSGLGDLLATCYSEHSRNRKFGILLASNYSVSNSINSINMAVEGLHASKIIHKLITRYDLDMPICRQVYDIVYKSKNPSKSLDFLMKRSLKAE